MIRRENDERQLPASEVLLIPDILVAGQYQIEPCLLGRIEQGTILQTLPSKFVGANYFVPSQEPCERRRGVGIEEDSHATATD